MRVLDLFCGSGGAATGYARAGWEVCRVLGQKRRRLAEARLAEVPHLGVADLARLLEQAETHPFLAGVNDRKWRANFGWLVATEGKGWAAIIEGSYAPKADKAAPQPAATCEACSKPSTGLLDGVRTCGECYLKATQAEGANFTERVRGWFKAKGLTAKVEAA